MAVPPSHTESLEQCFKKSPMGIRVFPFAASDSSTVQITARTLLDAHASMPLSFAMASHTSKHACFLYMGP